MFCKIKSLLASTAVAACLFQITPSHADTVVHETVTETPNSTTTSKTVTTTTDADTTVIPVDPTVNTTTNTHWKTETHFTGDPDRRVVNLMEFDLNHDGVLSFNEVARMLFKLYDTDGNGIIDNNEYEHPVRISVAPVEKDTVVTYDYGDGTTETIKRTYHTFMEDSHLALLDNSKDGISAHEFTGRDFMSVDVNRDHAIDMNEWKGTYIASVDKKNREKANLNQ